MKPISEMTITEAFEVPTHIFVPYARAELGIETATELAQLLKVAPQTVWRWERDPALYESARNIEPQTRQVLLWMLQPGRPEEWPTPMKERQAAK